MCFLLHVAPFYCLGWVIGERWYARFTEFLAWPCGFFGGCVSYGGCSAADSLRFCSFLGERICIILALIFFLPKQRAVRVVICSLHICSIVCVICPVVFSYVFIFNFQILPNSDISSLAQISSVLEYMVSPMANKNHPFPFSWQKGSTPRATKELERDSSWKRAYFVWVWTPDILISNIPSPTSSFYSRKNSAHISASPHTDQGL